MLVCSGRPTQSKRGGGDPISLISPGSGVVSAMTPNSEPLAGSSTRRVSNSMTMLSTLSCCSRLGIGFIPATGKKEGIGTQPCKDTECPVRSGRPFLVVDDKMQRLAAGQRAGAALDRLCAVAAVLERVESTAEANFLIARLELRRIAKARHRGPTHDERVIDHIGKHRAGARRGKHTQREHRAVRVGRARERKQIAEIARRVADLSGPIDMV